MTQRSVLDTAGSASFTPRAAVTQSDWRLGILETGHINGATAGARHRRQITLSWPLASAATARAVRAHYDANAHDAFEVYLAGESSATDVIYLQPPTIQAAGNRAFSINVQLEQALITD